MLAGRAGDGQDVVDLPVSEIRDHGDDALVLGHAGQAVEPRARRSPNLGPEVARDALQVGEGALAVASLDEPELGESFRARPEQLADRVHAVDDAHGILTSRRWRR